MFHTFFKTNYLISFVSKCNFASKSVGILGAPFNKGQNRYGVDKAPDALRECGLINQLQELGVDVKDYGNLKFEDCVDSTQNGKILFPLTVSAACKKLSNGVKKVLLNNEMCITIGGDHSLGMGTVHGHSQVHDVCVLWIDAHADINTTITTLSGHLHGLPLAFLVKELQQYQPSFKGFEWLKPCLKKENLAFIGLRDIDPLEKLILNKEEIVHFTMRDVDKFGIFDVTHRALEAINPTGKLSLHVSFDIDSIDQLIAPSTGTPVIGGLTVREALSIAEEVSKLDNFHALDMMEINPSIGSDEQAKTTLHIGEMMIKAFLGFSRQGNAPKDVQEVPTA